MSVLRSRLGIFLIATVVANCVPLVAYVQVSAAIGGKGALLRAAEL
jgi:hypothetical protein